METSRVFIALELTPEIQGQLGQIQEELQKSAADVKWVRPQGIHLTLRFLGNVSLELIEEIKNVVGQLVKAHQGFEMKITELGAFPKVEHPRVIWVSVEEKGQVAKLVQDLEERLIHLGFLREKRPFKPHLTLGRVRSAHNREQLKKLLRSITFPQKSMQAESVCLFKSTLTPQGAIYQPLYKANLS